MGALGAGCGRRSSVLMPALGRGQFTLPVWKPFRNHAAVKGPQISGATEATSVPQDLSLVSKTRARRRRCAPGALNLQVENNGAIAVQMGLVGGFARFFPMVSRKVAPFHIARRRSLFQSSRPSIFSQPGGSEFGPALMVSGTGLVSWRS